MRRADHHTNELGPGIVNVVVGFAALKPAEFVVITLQQMAGRRPVQQDAIAHPATSMMVTWRKLRQSLRAGTCVR
ncbi:hypothetical protein BH18ACI5_BH18ACI5_19570 [soil metagenome]